MNAYEHDQFFPSEAFDIPQDDEVNDSELLSHEDIASRLNAESRAVRDSYSGTWDGAHERELGSEIQAGLLAEVDAEAMGDRYDGRFDDAIEHGKQARHDLVTANLPFAAYFARASMGINGFQRSPGTIAVPIRNGGYMGRLKTAGAFSDIAKLRSNHASLVDRTQVAMEAMWHASSKYCEDTENAKSAKFVTYAAWHVHHALRSYCSTEMTGWDVSPRILDQYRTALNEERLHGRHKEIRHLVEGRGFHRGLHPEQMFEGRESVPAGSVLFVSDETDVFDEVISLRHEEVVASSDESTFDSVAKRTLVDQFEMFFDSLSERDASVIAMRFGLDDGRPKTLDEIGKVYGVTRERVRQVKSRAMSKLRHPDRSKLVQDFLFSLDNGLPANTLSPLAEGTSNLKTQLVVAHKADVDQSSQHELETTKATERDPNLEDWQAFEGDTWEDSVRDNNQPKRKSIAAQDAYPHML